MVYCDVCHYQANSSVIAWVGVALGTCARRRCLGGSASSPYAVAAHVTELTSHLQHARAADRWSVPESW